MTAPTAPRPRASVWPVTVFAVILAAGFSSASFSPRASPTRPSRRRSAMPPRG